MKNEIEDLINEQFSNMDTSLEDLYTNNSIYESIENQANVQNETIQKEEYRQDLLKRLEAAKEMRCELDYNENMSIEELENILNSIKI